MCCDGTVRFKDCIGAIMMANGRIAIEDGLDGFNEIKFKHLIQANQVAT